MPSRLGHQQQGIEMGDQSDLMPLHLVGTAALVFGSRCGQPLARFEFRVFVAAACGPFAQLPFIFLEVMVDAFQFPS
jgi:hypothetical protein